VVRSLAALAGLLWIGAAVPLLAQRDPPHAEITLPASTEMQEGPSVTTANLLVDARTRELLRNGLPTRIHYRLELWKKGGLFGLFYDLAGKSEWDVLVQYDPMAKLFNVYRRMGTQLQETFVGTETVTAAEAEFEHPFRVPLVPTKSGRYYYNLVVEVQTVSESDLDALRQWFRGADAPGKANPIGTIQSGVGTVVSRLLGSKDTYAAQSATFSVP
jgi:hypothetical protein